MKLLIVGDFKSNTGPASVNKSLLKASKGNILYTKEKSLFNRIIELIIKIFRANYVVFSGISQINIIGIILCKILNKKSAYLMHGCLEYENYINGVREIKGEKLEKNFLKLIPKIICVSEQFCIWCKKRYPEYEKKITFVNNGIDWDNICEKNKYNFERDSHTILSVGGGMPRKNIKMISKAIIQINKENMDSKPLKLIVIGKTGTDIEEIKNNPYVEYISEVNYQDMKFYYAKSSLYIQNSTFETFGLAPIEALANGNNILISKFVGSISIFNNFDKEYIIKNPKDVNEIKEKILNVLKNPNNNLLMQNINKEKTSIYSALENLIQTIH